MHAHPVEAAPAAGGPNASPGPRGGVRTSPLAEGLLEVEGVSTGYGSFRALFDVSLHVDEGEILAVIGANGAGKSTLLKTICGLLRTEDSTVRFDGRPIGTLPAHKRVGLGISLVPEGRLVFPSLTVHENLLVGGHSRRTGPWSVSKVRELFPLLDRLMDKQAAHLSGGEQQALAIGRGLMANPRLLLLDEVSLGLAPIVVTELYKAIPRIVAEGTTLIIVEQDIGQAVAVADRIVCLLEGRVVLQGRPDEVTREQISAAYFGI
ncbi:MAG: ABC transporter ATP-binding protein [Actinobacteria bacterium]|nr:ABC transporter ATP-binding protein [Actinomycetota bacterium]